MSRNTDYQFIPTDPEEIKSRVIRRYEEMANVTLRPADPIYLIICWVVDVLIQERTLNNYTGNQNIPSRAEGENLDALAELFFEKERPGERAASCTMRFYISEPQSGAVLVPAGTRVTDSDNTLIWETVEDVYVNAGDSYVDTDVVCQTIGIEGNGYAAGQINKVVDVYDYYSKCENITASDGGTGVATDDEFYELMRASEDAYSTAGPVGAYVYHAKRVSTEIADVTANSPTPGEVYIYALMKDGTPAGETIKNKILEECNADSVRPMTDLVHTGDPETVSYNIELTYYLQSGAGKGAADIRRSVDEAVKTFTAWQSAKLGRDINPSYLIQLLMQTGIKRVALTAPTYTVLRDGKLDMRKVYELPETVPQIAKVDKITVTSGGYEDE